MSSPTPIQLAASAFKRGRRASVEVAGSQTNYWVYGADQPNPVQLILIHGYRGNHHGLEAIAGALTNFEVVIPDLPGFGESAVLAAEHTVSNYANWLLEFVNKVSPNAVIVGHSFGTIVVAAAANAGLSNPIALINPVSRFETSLRETVLQRLVDFFYWSCDQLPQKAGSALCGSPIFVRAMSEVLAKTKDRQLRKWIHGQHATNFSDFQELRVAIEGYRASTSTSVADYVQGLSQPVLLIAAQQDDITSVANQEKLLRQLPDASLRVLPNVGHLVHYETPMAAARLIEEFCLDL